MDKYFSLFLDFKAFWFEIKVGEFLLSFLFISPYTFSINMEAPANWSFVEAAIEELLSPKTSFYSLQDFCTSLLIQTKLWPNTII